MCSSLCLTWLIRNWLSLVAIYQVDLVLFGHTHVYERICSIYRNECKALPRKDETGIDVYDHSNYSAPVHAIIGMAGFTLDDFQNQVSRSQRLPIYLSPMLHIYIYISCTHTCIHDTCRDVTKISC
jgi:hypothetical protein